MKRISPEKGLLFHFIKTIDPALSKRIAAQGVIDTIVIGLGTAGTRHAGLMSSYGTRVTAGIAPGRSGTRLHEVIPVYDTVAECMEDYPDIAVASIWKHYSTAAQAAIEAIEAGIPVVVLISEGIPQRDVRDVLAVARKRKTLLIGGNTPGIIFPPEGIKVGMLPDVFYPQEPKNGIAGPNGVTIVSRSGAILYHVSDGLSSVGIAQNAVLGVGGDGTIGSTFRKLVPLAMEHGPTDLVVVAGEIGGIQEELLAEDIRKNPSRYPKPIVALISGANAPEGKTMGHAGAIISPGTAFGTFESKRDSLKAVGVVVVNSQYDLIAEVQKKLKGKTYFQVSRYYERMREFWEEPPVKPTWSTLITKAEPNVLMISGYKLQDLIGRFPLLDVAHLLIKGELPQPSQSREYQKVAMDAAMLSAPKARIPAGEDISKSLAKLLILDETVARLPDKGKNATTLKTAYTLGRMVRYLARVFGNEAALDGLPLKAPFGRAMVAALTGSAKDDKPRAGIIEAMVVASVDHGVTPPSTQAGLITASVRAAYEVSVAAGISAITDVHGGAGANAARFFLICRDMAKKQNVSLEEAVNKVMTEYVKTGARIEGLGHRVHTNDPRRDALWKMAEKTKVAGDCVKISKVAGRIFEMIRGLKLPINVDGVIGSIVADMGLPPSVAKALFVFGRVAGLSAHYFEEVASQLPMRQIVFADAVYRGIGPRVLQS